jgi:alanyl-tRNA synthetase
MKRMTSAEIRQSFLDFFAEREHQVVASSSLVPGSDPTLLFTNAGMVQFKDVFLGIDKRPYQRATTSQKCMRISGKHNDLENVGPSPRHHTFFEMLGNFSFGDYFKRDAIRYAYELLTQVYGLPPDRLAYTVYESDDEAYDAWVKDIGVDPARVARMGPKTNFWQMAETGPCGPTSEVHWDTTPELGTGDIIEALEREDDRFLELWNLVFMQFNRTQDDPAHTGRFDEPLPAPGVDTGLGLERVVAVMQKAETNYDTDLFTDIMDATQKILGHDDAFREEHFVAYRVIADHTRAAAFLIADGVTPGNTQREYVTRMLIRRAMLFAHKMGVDRPFLHQVADAVIGKLGGVYPELEQFKEAIHYHISTEEERFLHTLDSSLGVLDSMIEQLEADKQSELSGSDAFFLFATHGLPLEITRDVLQEHRMSVDEPGFEAAMEEHSRLSGGSKLGEFEDVSVYRDLLASLKESGALGEEGVIYNPYEHLTLETEVVAIIADGRRVEQLKGDAQENAQIVLAGTPFYVESGGQVSDTGVIAGEGWEFEVTDMIQPVGGLILHLGRLTYGDAAKVGDSVKATVNDHRRWDIMRNHTATHLLHASLREVLGKHVRQKGSLVAPDRLRFDFSHNEAVAPGEIDRIAGRVNELILSNRPVRVAFKPLEQARREGAMALFGEKYGETVRTVTVGDPASGDERWSYELCGGTHVTSTAEIGPFLITGESSSASGVRRVVAVTGHEAQRLIQERLDILDTVATRLGSEPETVEERVDDLLGDLKEATSKVEKMERQSSQSQLDNLVSQAKTIGGAKVVAAQVDAPDGDMLGQMADWCRDRIDSGVVVLGSEIDGKVRLVAKVTPDLTKRGVHAGDLLSTIARLVGGGGGGRRPDFATAGGKDPSGLPEALARAEDVIAGALK